MRHYPRIGTRVIILSGKWAGRQAKTMRKEGGAIGWIVLELLGGVMPIGAAVPLTDIAPDPTRKISKLPPRPLTPGSKLYSRKGVTLNAGFLIRVHSRYKRGDNVCYRVTTDNGHAHRELIPTPGFEKRWCHADGAPVLLGTP